MRSADRCDFEALRSREGQAEAILVAYDIMEADGQDVRPEPLEERRNRLVKALSRNSRAMRPHPIERCNHMEWAVIFRRACWDGLKASFWKRVILHRCS
jgi:ATP-dependent DNA ligase